MEVAGEEPFPPIYVDSKEEGKVNTDVIQFVSSPLSFFFQKWAMASQSQLKKNKKLWEANKRKQKKNLEKQEEDRKKREENLEKAKSVVIQQDTSLPPPTKVRLSTLTAHHHMLGHRLRSKKGRHSGGRG